MIDAGKYTCCKCEEDIYLDPPSPRFILFECPECEEVYPCELDDETYTITHLRMGHPEDVRREFAVLTPTENGVGWPRETTPAEAFDTALKLWETAVTDDQDERLN